MVVVIADYCFISKDAKIGNGTKLYQGACIYGDTEIGENNEIFSYSVLGSKPQDLKFNDEKVKPEAVHGDLLLSFSLSKIPDKNAEKDEQILSIIGDACAKIDYINPLGYVVRGLVSTPQFRQNGSYFAT